MHENEKKSVIYHVDYYSISLRFYYNELAMQNKLYSGRTHICFALLKHGLSTFFSNPWVLWITLCDFFFYGKNTILMSSCLLYNSWGGALAPPPYPKLSHDRVTSTQRKLEQKYLLFLRVENPKEQEIPHCGGYARPQGLGCLRSNALRLGFASLPPSPIQVKKSSGQRD